MIKFYGDMGAAQGISTLSDMVDALDFWQDNTIVNPGDIARSSTNSMIYAVAQTAGVTGTVEPVWGNAAGVTLTDNTVTWLVKDIRAADTAKSAAKWVAPIKINGIDVDGSHDITLPTDTVDNTSYIGSGLKVSSFDGLNVNISSGRAKIAGNGISFAGGKLALNPRKASLMYLDSTGTLGKVDCANPADFIDDGTIAMWIFNQTTAGANVQNSAVGKSKNAVDNDMVPSGGIASVDGRFDYATKLDGLSGKYTSQNYLNIPIGAAAREVNILWTAANRGIIQEILWWGGNTSNLGFNLFQLDNNNITMQFGGSSYDTGFTMASGTDYFITVGYTGTAVYVKVNGAMIYPPVKVDLATTGTNVCVCGQWASSYGYGAGVVHFIEIRNVLRSDIATAVMANKFILPCFYDKIAAVYPSVPAAYATVCHEYRFDETSGTTVADSNASTALNGTATGTTVADSDLFLGKARKFNGTSDKIVTGNFSCGTKFSYVGVVTIPAYGAYALWSNRAADVKSGNLIYVDASGYLYLYRNTSAYKLTNTPVPIGTPFFVAVTINGTNAVTYLNSCQTSIATTISMLDGTTLPVNLGFEACAANYLNGTYEYCLYGNYELAQSEIAQIYNALMCTGRRNIIDDVIPANAISVGFIRTNSMKIIEKNDSWYKFGRREGATGGNRKVFLPWKYFSGNSALSWENPFGSGRYKKEIHWAQDAKGTNELSCFSRFDSGSASANYGTLPIYYSPGHNDAQNVNVWTSANGVTCFNGTWETSGYLGVYIECLEDYKGADAA